ncbi:MAG TPA: hypothetical protein VK468_00465 [Pyrinomonadaceae bacterium]|nr:hypothetical protein [Pyrinomonadaceae bacterium]
MISYKKFILALIAVAFSIGISVTASNAQGRSRWNGNQGRHNGWSQGRHRGWDNDRNRRGWDDNSRRWAWRNRQRQRYFIFNSRNRNYRNYDRRRVIIRRQPVYRQYYRNW